MVDVDPVTGFGVIERLTIPLEWGHQLAIEVASSQYAGAELTKGSRMSGHIR